MAEAEEIEDIDIHDLIHEGDVSHPVSLREAEKMWGNRENYKKIFLITSQDSGKKYLVGEMKDGRWRCSCPHFVFRLKQYYGECKHITFVKANINTLVPLYDSTIRETSAVITMFNNVIPEEVLESGGVYLIDKEMEEGIYGGIEKAGAEFEEIDMTGLDEGISSKISHRREDEVIETDAIDEPMDDLLPDSALFSVDEGMGEGSVSEEEYEEEESEEEEEDEFEL